MSFIIRLDAVRCCFRFSDLEIENCQTEPTEQTLAESTALEWMALGVREQ